jgi:hypothetical protein
VPSKKQTIDDEIAAYWLDKYGEPIDCYELKKCAALVSVERERSAVAALRLFAAYSELLERQSGEQREFFERRVPGSRARFDTYLDTLMSAAGEDDWKRRKARLERLLTALEGRDPRRSALSVARSAHPAELLYVLQFAQRRATAQAAELADTAFRRIPEWRWKAETRSMDVALAHAAYGVSEWIRPRHRNRGGRLDRYPCWPDVARCLRWYGHRVAGAEGVRKLVYAWKAKRDSAPRTLDALRKEVRGRMRRTAETPKKKRKKKSKK